MPTKMKRRVSKRAAAAALPAGVESDLVQSLERAPRLHGLDELVARVESLITLEGRRPVLVGPPEVGKSAVAWGIAKRIADGARPAGAKAIWEVSLRSLDLTYGKEEGAGPRLAAILREAAASPSKPIVFVRDLRTLRSVDAQHALVEALEHSRVAFLAEAWPGLTSWLSDDPELAGVLHVVRIEEPTAAQTVSMLRAEAAEIKRLLRVSVDPAAIDRIVHDMDRLQPQRRFPGKAFALLDEVAREAVSRADRTVTPARVTDRVCESLRLPRFLVDPETPFDAAKLRAHLAKTIVGNSEAIGAVVERLALYKSEMCEPSRPLGVLLLAGPPGVGKSRIAQEVAQFVFGSAKRIARISLAEHSEDWKVDQLFGQRGSASTEARRGILTRQLAGKPFSVLLLDEVEKAHPLAYKHLLRPLDEGAFINGNDEEVSLRNTLVILTASVGTDVYRDTGLGFARADAAAVRSESVRKRVADTFPADLLDRVDRVSVCPPFGDADALTFARRELTRALGRATAVRHGVDVEVTDAALAALVAEARRESGSATGGRGLRRVLDRRLIATLALELLERPVSDRTRIVVDWTDGAMALVRSHEPAAAVAEGPVRPQLKVMSGSAVGTGVEAQSRRESDARPAERAAARGPSEPV